MASREKEALNVPAALSLRRWMLKRPDSPWYPILRIIRQEYPGDWAGVFRRVAAELARRPQSAG
jgi:hypothetical protein